MKDFLRNVFDLGVLGKLIDLLLMLIAHLTLMLGMVISLFAILGIAPLAVVIMVLNFLPLDQSYLLFGFSPVNVVGLVAFFLSIPYLIWVFYRFCIQLGCYHFYLFIQGFKRP